MFACGEPCGTCRNSWEGINLPRSPPLVTVCLTPLQFCWQEKKHPQHFYFFYYFCGNIYFGEPGVEIHERG